MNRMYKIGVIFFVFVFIFSMIFLSAGETTDWDLNETKMNKAYSCLENKTQGRASSATLEEVAFVILASPKSAILSEYKNELISRKKVISDSEECWPKEGCKIKESALALLALNHLRENTAKVERWLLSKNRTATDITWLLQEDSESETKCIINYDQKDYETTISSDKKINSPAGSCLQLYQNRFWFQISKECYDKEFILSCDRDFIANFLYKKTSGESVLYVDSNTQSSPANGEVELRINSKCFGLSSCEYEGSLWATFALLKKGYEINSFIPYLIALSDSNKAYLPEAFIYIITNFEDYGNLLIQNQNTGNFWQAPSSPNGKFYDTALALIALSNSNSEQVAKARKRMERYQDADGCWISQKTVRDTAILLWSLLGKAPSLDVVPAITYCDEAGFFCIETARCGIADRVGENYHCTGSGLTCCEVENLQTCAQRGGLKCPSNKICSGITEATSDEEECCLLSCVDPVVESECENNDNICMNSCSSNYEEVDEECNNGRICCKKIEKKESNESLWWIWLIILGIIILIAIIAYIQKDKIKLWWFKKKNNVRGGPVSSGGFRPGPPFGGNPGMQRPIMQRPMIRRPMINSARPINYPKTPQLDQNTSEDDEVFRRLREMSK